MKIKDSQRERERDKVGEEKRQPARDKVEKENPRERGVKLDLRDGQGEKQS